MYLIFTKGLVQRRYPNMYVNDTRRVLDHSWNSYTNFQVLTASLLSFNFEPERHNSGKITQTFGAETYRKTITSPMNKAVAFDPFHHYFAC
jgi:hypothetical protein